MHYFDRDRASNKSSATFVDASKNVSINSEFEFDNEGRE